MKQALMISLCGLALSATAGLEWKNDTITLQVHPAQVSAEAVFSYTNSGPDSVTIDAVNVLCGCLSTKPYRKTCAPGETGQITIVYNLRNRTGKQEKHVRVQTHGGEQTDLCVDVNIPLLYNSEPRLLTWKAGEKDIAEKTVRLRNPNKMPIKLLSVVSSSKDFPVQLKTIKEGFEYEVTVGRCPADQKGRAVIRLETDPPPGLKKSKTVKLYVLAQ